MSPRSNPLPACIVCDRLCIPLADYDDAVVCHRCDDTFAQALERARFAVPAPAPARLPIIPSALIAQLGDAWAEARRKAAA